MSWRGRRVFITGATGFVGSWLTSRLLDEGAETAVLVRDWDPRSELIRSGAIHRCRVISGRLEDFRTLERAICDHQADTVFHLGAQAIVGTALGTPLDTFESNIRGTYNLLEACRTQKDLVQRLVIASSDKAYGESLQLPYREDMPAQGRHPYDVSKSCTDLLAQTYAHTYGLPLVVARCGNIYGGSDLNWSRLIPGTILALLRGEAPVVRSDGTFLRDYVYLQDAVDAYLTLAEAAGNPALRGEAFNFGPNQPASVLDVIGLLLEAAGRTDLQPRIENTARAEIRDQYLDASKARDLLGWRPSWDLRRGLADTLAWYRTYLGA